jgi:Integrase core domain
VSSPSNYRRDLRNLNPFAERFVRTIKEGCLEQMILFGQDALRRAIQEFVAHYHLERNHQRLRNRFIVPLDAATEKTGPVRMRQRLGGILDYYYRDAAWQFESGWFLMCESSFWIVRDTEKIFRQLTARTEKGDGYKRLDLRVSPREKARR